MKQFSFHLLTTSELQKTVAQEFAANSRLRELFAEYASREVNESQSRLIKFPPDILTASTANRELGRQESFNRLLNLTKELA